MNRCLLVLVGGLALICAAAMPVDGPVVIHPVQKEDCTLNGLDCGTKNDACRDHAGARCFSGSVGDPDGDGCGCGIPT